MKTKFHVLPAPKNSILPGFEAILRAFENVSYVGELRPSWVEIKIYGKEYYRRFQEQILANSIYNCIMSSFLTNILNRITMYRLMLYFLLTLWLASIILSLTDTLPYDPLDILSSGIILGTVCNLTNYLFAKIFKVRTNLESASITALILTLIIGPSSPVGNFLTMIFIGAAAMASKYVFALNKKHIFNPAAFAVFLAATILNDGASWWIGSIYTFPLIVLGGLLILTKIKRFELVIGFFTVYFLTLIFFGKGVTVNSFFIPSIWFYVFVMLVEPLTSPSTKNKQIVFGGFAALSYFLLPKVIPGYAYGLETALLAGNLLSFAISNSFNVVMVFKRKEKVAKNTWAFYFEPMSEFKFIPGQYLEWTLPHKNPDSRGTRRYFTVCSSPEEKEIMFTIRIAEKGSSFKSALMRLKEGEEITASSPQGEFVLPQDKTLPLVFIAGGIGITPFRSMIKSMLLHNNKRDIVLLYSNRQEADIAFKKVLDHAKGFGVRTVYVNTEKDRYIDEEMIKEKVPGYQNRIFYVSGAEPMVETIKKLLSQMKIKMIKTDFFPGYREI